MKDYALSPQTKLYGGRYSIEDEKGRGGFGVTYTALDHETSRQVVIKELYWRDHCTRDAVTREVRLSSSEHQQIYEELRLRFRSEADTLAQLEGLPGVVRLLGRFEENGTSYIVMEDVKGETLAKHIGAKGAQRPEADTLCRRFLPLMESIGRIHDRGIIHRDISPENIILSPEGEVTLIDFGSASTYQREDGARFTTIAKDGYAPGEQYKEGERQGPWSDVYAMCATLYTCLTGVTPESARTRRILDEVKAPSRMGVKITPELEAVIMRGLAMDAGGRYADMHELSAAIRKAMHKAKRRRGLTGLAAVLLALALGFAGQQAAQFFIAERSAPGNAVQAVWENTILTDDAGRNQVRAGALKGETNAYLFEFYNADTATEGEWNDQLRTLRRRLDTLDTPYAFGMGEESGHIAIRISPDKISDFVLGTLADNLLHITGERSNERVTLSHNREMGTSGFTVEEDGAGGYTFRCEIGEEFGYEEMVASMRARGEETLYLRNSQGDALAQAPLANLDSGVIEFSQLRIEGAEHMNADTRFIAEYVNAVINTPQLPFSGSLVRSEPLDGEGNAVADKAAAAGMRLPRTPGEEALVDIVRSIARSTGYTCFESAEGTIFIHADLPVDDDMPEKAAALVDHLLGSYPLSERIYNHPVVIMPIDEAGEERFRVALGRRIAFDDEPGAENDITGYLFGSERLEPYREALDAWWQSLPDVYHGFSVVK